MALKEKDIVNYIVVNFDKFFPELKFNKTEYKLRDFRVDILASFYANLKDYNLRDKDYYCFPSVFIEVKHKSLMRDLLFEMNKQIEFRDWYINTAKALCIICVLSDDFNKSMVDYMEKNNIMMFKYHYENDDITTLTIEEYNSSKYISEHVEDDDNESKIKKANQKQS